MRRPSLRSVWWRVLLVAGVIVAALDVSPATFILRATGQAKFHGVEFAVTHASAPRTRCSTRSARTACPQGPDPQAKPQVPRVVHPRSPSFSPRSPQAAWEKVRTMNHTDAITEIVDRLRRIGTLGDHLADGRMDVGLALDTAHTLLEHADEHVDPGRSSP